MSRGADLLLAVVATVLLAPLVLVVALVVRVGLGSPVLFRQVRSGRDGVVFEIVKFRTMRDERYPGEPDPSRTPALGALLRATSVDELPQLWNVLRGDMALVGPRPTLPEQVARYGPRERGRLAVRPGVTGWAQVHGRNSLSWPERIELDLWYVAHRSLALDLRVLVLTLLRLVRPSGITGAGGVNPGYELDAAAPAPAPVEEPGRA